MKLALLFLVLINSIAYSQYNGRSLPPEKYKKIWSKILNSDMESAQKKLERHLKKQPSDPWPYFLMGLTFEPNSEYSEAAIPYWEKSLSIDSNFFMAHSYLAMRLASTSDSTDTERISYHFNRAISIDSTDDMTYLNRATFYYNNKRYDEAIADGKHVLTLGGSLCSFAHYTILLCLTEQEKVEELHNYVLVNKLVNCDGIELFEYEYLLGTIYYDLYDHPNACICFQKALSTLNQTRSLLDEAYWLEQSEKVRSKMDFCQ